MAATIFNLALTVQFDGKGNPTVFKANYCSLNANGWTINKERILTQADTGYQALSDAVAFIPKLIAKENP